MRSYYRAVCMLLPFLLLLAFLHAFLYLTTVSLPVSDELLVDRVNKIYKNLSSEVALQVPAEIKPFHVQQFSNLSFNYTINNKLCINYKKKLLAIILVASQVNNVKLRTSQRLMTSQSKLLQLGFQRIFLLTTLPVQQKYPSQSEIRLEQLKYGDLLQANLTDAYHRLSYLYIMALRWTIRRCWNAKFIAIINEDLIYDFNRLRTFLETLEARGYANNLLADYMFVKELLVQQQLTLAGKLYITNPITVAYLVNKLRL